MSYYNVCEHCGSNLDPGEKCDCMNQQEEKETRKMKEKVFCEREKETLINLKGAFVTNVETTDEGVVISVLKTDSGRLCRDEYFIPCDSYSERVE